MKYLYLDLNDGLDNIERRNIKIKIDWPESPYDWIKNKAEEMNKDLREVCSNDHTVRFRDHVLVKINAGLWRSKDGSYIKFNRLVFRLK